MTNFEDDYRESDEEVGLAMMVMTSKNELIVLSYSFSEVF